MLDTVIVFYILTEQNYKTLMTVKTEIASRKRKCMLAKQLKAVKRILS
jgi:hypothetical protein